jgi:hypothetical protein
VINPKKDDDRAASLGKEVDGMIALLSGDRGLTELPRRFTGDRGRWTTAPLSRGQRLVELPRRFTGDRGLVDDRAASRGDRGL